MTDQMTRDYTVQGMSCEHCRASVIEEVAEIEGVESVAVDLDTGHVTVRGVGFTDLLVAAAVDLAGYRIAGSE